jgi:acyl-coenzyme A synthetase/AMP-(fatty) acid ligase
LSFDVAFQETFSTLCTGGTLVLLNEWIRRDAHALSEFLSHHRIQRLFVPPLMLQSLAECATPLGPTQLSATPSPLQEIITAGEPLRISPQIVDWVQRLDGCRVHNHYGPTETHVVTALTLSGDPQQWPALPAIGRPIANVQIQVLDGQRQPVPLGVAGEIYIGGVALAHGYRGRPELTEQRFVKDPNNPESGSRLYRTGDLGRWQADGTLEYLGRNDDQVKLRGYRIELGEIEAQLLRHAAVREAVVVVREDTPGEKRLVAYLIAPNQDSPSAEALRTHLKAVLPEHMIPSAFVPLESWPLTPNGKLNRRGLPAPEQGAYASSQYEPPQGETETALAAIWAQLLHLPRVGRHDNFFELGGHSLHGMKLVSQVSDVLNVNLLVIAVFQFPTIQDMARVVESLRPLEGNRTKEVEESEFEEGIL